MNTFTTVSPSQQLINLWEKTTIDNASSSIATSTSALPYQTLQKIFSSKLISKLHSEFLQNCFEWRVDTFTKDEQKMKFTGKVQSVEKKTFAFGIKFGANLSLAVEATVEEGNEHPFEMDIQLFSNDTFDVKLTISQVNGSYEQSTQQGIKIPLVNGNLHSINQSLEISFDADLLHHLVTSRQLNSNRLINVGDSSTFMKRVAPSTKNKHGVPCNLLFYMLTNDTSINVDCRLLFMRHFEGVRWPSAVNQSSLTGDYLLHVESKSGQLQAITTADLQIEFHDFYLSKVSYSQSTEKLTAVMTAKNRSEGTPVTFLLPRDGKQLQLKTISQPDTNLMAPILQEAVKSKIPTHLRPLFTIVQILGEIGLSLDRQPGMMSTPIRAVNITRGLFWLECKTTLPGQPRFYLMIRLDNSLNNYIQLLTMSPTPKTTYEHKFGRFRYDTGNAIVMGVYNLENGANTARMYQYGRKPSFSHLYQIYRLCDRFSNSQLSPVIDEKCCTYEGFHCQKVSINFNERTVTFDFQTRIQSLMVQAMTDSDRMLTGHLNDQVALSAQAIVLMDTGKMIKLRVGTLCIVSTEMESLQKIGGMLWSAKFHKKYVDVEFTQ